MDAVHAFAGVAVEDLAAALDWYERLFGGPPDMRPNDSEAVWHVGPSASVYVVADPPRAGRALVMLMLDDLDGPLAALAERGIVPDTVEQVTGSTRKATITDPEGNTIALGDVRQTG